jgi:hypothetical protein
MPQQPSSCRVISPPIAGEIRSTTLKSDQQLLDLFLLHKAFYEIAYEAANRPGWLSIPVRGVMELLRRRSIVSMTAATGQRPPPA